jgi:pimeloyl-ACP methyl ester carboxylesterase
VPDIIDVGEGPPLVLVPGLPGRCEWMMPVIEALAERFRVLSLSLTAIPTDGFFDRATAQLDGTIDRMGTSRALVVGLSFGGLLAAVYAGRRPARVSSLVLASAPSPRHRLDAQSAGFAERPIVSLPLFAWRGATHIAPELLAALPSWSQRLSFAARFGATALRHPGSPTRMAAWVLEWQRSDLAADVRHAPAPTLVVTGDPHLDRVVPVESSRDYLQLIPGARHVTMPGTGHLGSLMRPHEFSALVAAFAEEPREARSD